MEFRMSRRGAIRSFALLSLTAAFCAGLSPLPLSLPAAQAKDAIYLVPGQLDLRDILPPPPAEGSLQAQAELEELHRIENARTPEQAQAALADEAEEDVFVFRTILGPNFTTDKLPLATQFFQHLRNDGAVLTAVAKADWSRQRPPVVDPTLHAIGHGKPGSYPSGHATSGWLAGLELAAMLPEKREAILLRAADYAHNRLVCGVHYPSDIVASQVAATALTQSLQQSAKFRADFATAKAEVRALLLAEHP